MDFDLFEQDEVDDILSTVILEPTQKQNETLEIEVIPEFQCSGEDSLTKSQFSSEGFIKNNFVSKTTEKQIQNKLVEALTFSSYEFQRTHLHGDLAQKFIFGETCMNIQKLFASILSPVGVYEELSFYQRRKQVTQLYYLLFIMADSRKLNSKMLKEVANIRCLISNITSAETWKSIYFANSTKGNDSNVPVYHFLHGVLEWKLLDLLLLSRLNNENEMETDSNSENEQNPNNFLKQLDRIFDDLISCSLYHFGKKHSADLLYSSPFPCTCFKEFWLFLQLAIQQWNNVGIFQELEKITFWSLFNKAMSRIKSKIAFYSLTPLTFCEFANWLVAALVRLYGYRSNGQFEGPHYSRATQDGAENYEFLENCTQQFLNSNPNEEQLRVFISLIMVTSLQWWRPKVNIPMLLWEYFHKRLNSTFCVPGAALSNLAVVSKTGKGYIEKYKGLLEKQQPDGNLTSYTLFVLLMGKMMASLLKSGQQHQAMKLLGRIYTKFSVQKFLALSEMGIHHIIELFLVLALSGDFRDLGPKLRDKLLSIGLDKVASNKQIAVTKGHIALMILTAEQHEDLSDYIQKLLQQLNHIKNDLAVSKIIADGLLDIFEQSQDFGKGEYLLIDSWIPNFLNSCTPAEQERTLEALHLIFIKLETKGFMDESHAELLKSLHNHILPFLKQQYASNFSTWLPQLAADFCIYTCAASDTPSFLKLFQYFVEAQTANRQAIPQFLLKVLASEKGNLIEDTIVMQVWLKSLVLLTAVNEQVANLTKYIVTLPIFSFMTGIQAEDILSAKEPLCVFIAAVGKQYDSCPDYQKRCRISDNLNLYLRNFEKWLQADLKQEKTELTFRFYSFLAIVIYNCAPIVYAKSKITCFFHIALTRFILTTNIQMGKAPDTKLAQLIHKIWPVLIQGVGKLNFKADTYINKTLTDLIQKWTPYFKISTNTKIVARPFISCLQSDNPDLSLFVFEKLTNMFLTIQRRQADPNACLVITIYQEVVEAIGSSNADPNNSYRLETFLKGISLSTLEHIMMVDEIVPSRGMLLQLFKSLLNSTVYKANPSLQDLLAEHLRILTKKHLAYYTYFFFELLMKLTQISSSLVSSIMGFLLDEVKIVEAKRGAGEDNRIRGCLQKLQQAIANAQQKER